MRTLFDLLLVGGLAYALAVMLKNDMVVLYVILSVVYWLWASWVHFVRGLDAVPGPNKFMTSLYKDAKAIVLANEAKDLARSGAIVALILALTQWMGMANEVFALCLMSLVVVVVTGSVLTTIIYTLNKHGEYLE